MWKRVHVQPRRDLYIPQQTDDGPDVTRLTQHRTSIVRQTNGTRGNTLVDDWTTKRRATLDTEWTGSTNFEENTSFNDEFITEDIEEQTRGKKSARHTSTTTANRTRKNGPRTHTPTIQELVPVCVQSNCRADNHPEQNNKSTVTVIQVDITYYKSLGETRATPILTAVDVETGMCMALQKEDRTQHMQYLST